MAEVKKTMAPSFIQVQYTAASNLFHDPLVVCSGFCGHQVVAGTQKQDGWRGAALDIMQGGKVFVGPANPFVPISSRAVVDHGVEKHQSVGNAADHQIIAVMVIALNESRCRCQVPAQSLQPPSVAAAPAVAA